MRRLLTTTAASMLLLAAFSASAGAQAERTNQIHYPLNDELGAMLKTADSLRKAGKYAQAVELYRSILDSDDDYQLAELPKVAGQPRRLLGVTQWAMNGLRALPIAGVKVFRQKYDYRAKSALEKALTQKNPYQALSRAYELFPVSTHAVKILEKLADRALERGELRRAKQALKRLIEHHLHELPNPPRVRKKLLVCALGLGQADVVRRHALALKRDDPKGKIHLAGAPVETSELVAQALAIESKRAGRTFGSKPSAPLPRGDAANRATYPIKPAFGAQRFRPFRFADGSRYPHRVGGRLAPGSLSALGQPSRNTAVVHEGNVFLVTPDALQAYDLKTGQPVRRIRRPPGRPQFRDPNPKVQFGAAIDRGVLVAPFVQEVLRDQSYRGIPIKVRIPIRKLAAFELGNWRWKWDHGRSLVGTKMERWSFPTPPVAQEGLAFASAWSIEGFVNCNVVAFDVRTGKPRWSTWVASGQVEQTMFGEQATEPLCVPVALKDGVVYYSTSFGCVAALDADTGRPLWVTEYDQIEVRAPRGYYADPRNISWENNAPVIESGVMIAAPLDSSAFYGFDTKTGKRLWKSRQRRGSFGAEASMRYIMGADRGMVVLGGGGDVRCIDVRYGKRKWRHSLRGRLVAGRGIIAAGQACIPVDNNQVRTFDLESGNPGGTYTLSATGNLLIAGDNLVISGNGTVAVHRNGKVRYGRDFK